MLFKKAVWICLGLLIYVASPVNGQAPAGSIVGRVTDETGLAVPGVAVTVQGVDFTQSFTSDVEGRFRFVDLPPGSYRVTSSLLGFKTYIREQVVLAVGQTVDLPVRLAIGSFEQTVVVAAPSPIIDAAQTGVSTNVTADELNNVPTSRDPFAVLRSVAGVLVDRVNVGGNETGQQATFVSKGTRPQDSVWTLAGVAVTDMTLTGTSPTYFNQDNFEAIHVATAGQAITQPTGGAGLNFIVKRGTNLFHGGARAYFDNDSLEA